MFAIIDIETTGGNAIYDKITEIAIFIHDGTRIVDEFVTLINPEKTIPQFITNLTGINNEMVADAPKFYEVAKKIVQMTANKTFVAHNVSFDYNFVKNEFKSLGFDYKCNCLCTVKLSRKLIPALPSYSLGNLCQNLGIKITNRHRAAGDAFATVKLFEYLMTINNDGHNLFSGEEISSLKNLHPSLDRQKILKIPEEAGVYYFYDDRKELIYVGKSKNLYKRVMSHLGNTRSKRSLRMLEKICDLDYELTGNELIALLKESNEIKTNTPLFNRAQRRTFFNYGLYSYEDYDGYICFVLDKTGGDQTPLTTFSSKSEAIAIINKWVEKYMLCKKLCGIQKANNNCFPYILKECNGACVGEEAPEIYNSRVKDLLKEFEFQHNNFFIIDKGRKQLEKSVIKIENGKYQGFGFFDVSEGANLDTLNDCIQSFPDNRDVKLIIKNYLRKYKVEKIITF